MLTAAVGAAVVGALVGRVADGAAVTGRRVPGVHTRVVAPAPVGALAALGAGRGTAAASPHWSARAVGAPLPEVVGALVTVAVVLRFGTAAELPAWLWLGGVGLLLAIVDLREQLLPNCVVLPGLLVALALFTAAAAVDDGWASLRRAVLAAVVCFALLLTMALAAPAGLGMGDVKLGALLGLYLGWLGWPAVLTGLLLAFVLQAVVALALLAARRVGRRADLPFGPALLAGALGAALLTGGGVVTGG